MHTTGSWARRVARGCLVAAGLAAAAIWGAGSVLIHPAPRHIGPPPGDIAFRDLTFASDTGLPVHGWFVPGQPGRGAVLLLHGVRASRLSMLPRARFLHRAGYAVLLIDFQATGESPGDAITFGYREARDASAAVHELRRLAPGESVGIIGTSMGGAAVLLAGPSIRADAMVLEQVYPSIDQALRDRLELHAGIAGRWLAWPFLTTLQPRLGLSSEQLRPIDRIGALATPKLLIVGACDRHTRLEESLAMYREAAAPKSLWIVAGAAHVDLHRFAGAAYEVRVLDFLGRWLRGERKPDGMSVNADAVGMLSSTERHGISETAPPCR
jgi:fermentation-respiration switch protein FrsA (DUF1100 family)